MNYHLLSVRVMVSVYFIYFNLIFFLIIIIVRLSLKSKYQFYLNVHPGFDGTCLNKVSLLFIITIHAFTRGQSQLSLSETEPKWFEFETSRYAFGGRISRFAKVNMNKVNILYRIVLILVGSCSFLCTLSLY